MRIALLLCLVSASAAVAQTSETAPEPAPDSAAEAVAADRGPTAAVEGGAEAPVSIDEIRRFVSVFRAVKQAYVEPVDDATLMRAAIRGLLTDLDPHSTYLDASQARDLDESTSGAYDGLGLEVVQNADRTLTVISPIDDTPAARAGIRPGDLIIEIDGKPINADNVDSAVQSMRGTPGSSISLTVVREGAAEPLRLNLTRETIRVASVKSRQLAPGFGYLRIATFQEDTAREAERKLAALAAAQPLQGLVLDLRSNPGGLLNTAIEVADQFLAKGVIVSTRGRLPFASSEYHATAGDALKGAPIVVLIDAGTASAAEVLAAALRDHRRALVMGSPSFGKGSVQTVLPIDNGDSLKLTTSRYYTPSGGSIQATGIQPDIDLPERVEWRRQNAPPSVRERNLPGHLESEAATPATAAPSGEVAPAADGDAGDAYDFALQEALALLKGLALYRPQP